MPSGTIISIPHNEIQKEDLLQVNEGDSIPSDGKIKIGSCTLDESMLTGESIPVEKKEGENPRIVIYEVTKKDNRLILSRSTIRDGF